MLLGFRVMHLYYYGFLSSVLYSPSFYVNTTNIARYNDRKGGNWDQTLRTVSATICLQKVLEVRMADKKFLVFPFLCSQMCGRVLCDRWEPCHLFQGISATRSM